MNTNQTSTPAPDRPAIQHLWTTTDRTFCGAEVGRPLVPRHSQPLHPVCHRVDAGVH